jgi:quercetin 2,3-dioxygenase
METVQRTVVRVETRTHTGPDAQVDDGNMVISPARPETDPFLLLGEAWFASHPAKSAIPSATVTAFMHRA